MTSFTYSFFQITLTTIFFISSSSSSSFASTTNSRPFKRIYAFGDSFTDTGNTRSVTGPSGFGHVSSSPYGMTFFHHPTNRYSDGRLVIDFVTQELYLPFLQPYILLKDKTNASSSSGVNFAVAGSTAINHAFFVKNNLTLDVTPQSIQTQLIWFNKFLESQGCKGGVTTTPGCKASVDDALFWVGEIGVNDYAYIVGSEVSGDTIRKLAISTKTQFLQELLKKGAKYVVVQGLPPSGCLPLAMSLADENDRDAMGCVKSVNNQCYTHNVAFQAKLQQLRIQFPQAVIVYADYWNAYATVFNNPARYGLKERFKACCGSGTPPYNYEVFAVCGSPSAKACPNPSQYINWDGVHLTEAMYKVVADMFLHGKFSHPPFSYLLDRKQRQG
ncbi:GDSL esterase/lipase [Tripterygium wilfordii]|uniref:GDSL esterase/lipase n=1 Tax=Tripterygium wilfordii TaxID=458696 RepID=A0A7J7C9S2_TRIWF|nr:GDSL esterase/lipase At3g48460 [Tripterygium wilfordii]KAF5730921.1 GDSL esterase/lipase [Tripterygium wilfordii]